jgi:hypothetical protein
MKINDKAIGIIVDIAVLVLLFIAIGAVEAWGKACGF